MKQAMIAILMLACPVLCGASEFYQGDVDQERVKKFMGDIVNKVAEVDTVVLARKTGPSTGEKFVVSTYQIIRVLKGQAVIDEYAAGDRIKVEYFNPKIGKGKPEPNGVTLMILERQRPGLGNLRPYRGRVHKGMIYGTQEVVSRIEAAVKQAAIR